MSKKIKQFSLNPLSYEWLFWGFIALKGYRSLITKHIENPMVFYGNTASDNVHEEISFKSWVKRIFKFGQHTGAAILSIVIEDSLMPESVRDDIGKFLMAMASGSVETVNKFSEVYFIGYLLRENMYLPYAYALKEQGKSIESVLAHLKEESYAATPSDFLKITMLWSEAYYPGWERHLAPSEKRVFATGVESIWATVSIQMRRSYNYFELHTTISREV